MIKKAIILALASVFVLCGCNTNMNVAPNSIDNQVIKNEEESASEETEIQVTPSPEITEIPEEPVIEEEIGEDASFSESENNETKEESESLDTASDTPESITLRDFKTADAYSAKISPGAADVTGEKYDNALVFHYINTDDRGEPYCIYYYLDGQYSTFLGDMGYCADNLVIKDIQENTEKMQIFGDDKELYSMDIDNHTPLEHFVIDITGVKVLKITYGDGLGKDRAMIANGEFRR